jgi:hypothetical protein
MCQVDQQTALDMRSAVGWRLAGRQRFRLWTFQPFCAWIDAAASRLAFTARLNHPTGVVRRGSKQSHVYKA